MARTPHYSRSHTYYRDNDCIAEDKNHYELYRYNWDLRERLWRLGVWRVNLFIKGYLYQYFIVYNGLNVVSEKGGGAPTSYSKERVVLPDAAAYDSFKRFREKEK